MSRLNEQMLRIFHDYRRETGVTTVDTHILFNWARLNKRWEAAPPALHQIFSKQLSSALRHEFHTDNQGRKVRSNHAVVSHKGGKQISLWGDIREAPEDHLRKSFSQRRRKLALGCKQLKTDVDSFNENRDPSIPYQFELDFTPDIAEMEIEQKLVRDRVTANEVYPISSRNSHKSKGYIEKDVIRPSV